MSTPNYDGYWKYLDDLNTRQIANSETYDNALLTLSSAFLGLSLTFIKDVVPFESAQCLGLLYLSWTCFCLCIVTVIGSFIYGQSVIDELRNNAKKYFINGDKSLDAQSKFLAQRISWLIRHQGSCSSLLRRQLPGSW